MVASRSGLVRVGLLTLGAVTSVILIVGCSKPLEANIELRKQNQLLQQRVDSLESLKKANEANRIVTTQRTVPGAVDLDRVVTVTGISFGRLTGVDGQALKVYVTPTDRVGDTFKASGGFQIDAYDLSKGTSALIGQWTFTPEQAEQAWNGKGLLYCYVLECPLSNKVGQELDVRVVYQDVLTGRNIEAKTTARVLRP